MVPAERCRERLLEPFCGLAEPERPRSAGYFTPCRDSSPGYSVNRPLQSGRGVWLGSGGLLITALPCTRVPVTLRSTRLSLGCRARCCTR